MSQPVPLSSRGTPPRVRGRQRRHRLECLCRGNTPAGAGTTSDGTWTSVPSGGTPPRVRGRHRAAADAGGHLGNTPAGAGTTAVTTISAPESAEHPRGCGDDFSAWCGTSSTEGTPPRVRGRPGFSGHGGLLEGNTPAGAGTTFPLRSKPAPRREHPRGCGDDPPIALVRSPSWGTPPRVRGRLRRRIDIDGLRGNTPAGAGTTTSASIRCPPSLEHPRGCGDDMS